MLIDTHCHLTDEAFAGDRDEVVVRMGAAGVDCALVIESRPDELAATRAWVGTQPALRLATACHPHDAGRWSPELREVLVDAWRDPLVRAVGEIGLDYHYDHSPRQVQREVFAEQLAFAVELGLPVVIHAREADDDIVSVLREQPHATIVLHSFSSGPVLRDAGLASGWYFSFSGMTTFKSWTLVDTVRAVSDDRLLLETDSPYLAPVPHRGQRNEPAWVVEVAGAVAAQRDTSPEHIARITSGNAIRLFWDAPRLSLTPNRLVS